MRTEHQKNLWCPAPLVLCFLNPVLKEQRPSNTSTRNPTNPRLLSVLFLYSFCPSCFCTGENCARNKPSPQLYLLLIYRALSEKCKRNIRIVTKTPVSFGVLGKKELKEKLSLLLFTEERYYSDSLMMLSLILHRRKYVECKSGYSDTWSFIILTC